MSVIQLGYGNSAIDFDFDKTRFDILAASDDEPAALSDREIGEAFDAAIDSPPLDEIVRPGQSVLIVASDATRATGSAQIINLLVRRLIQNGAIPTDIAIIFATGIHRAVRPREKVELLTSFIVQRIRTIDHDASDASGMLAFGFTGSGSPVRVNRALRDFDKVILTGGVSFHYFAGFTGGRKSICPGLAAAETVTATHMLALDFARGGRRRGVAPGILNGNAVNEECERVAALIDPDFSINAIVNQRNNVQRVFAGHWRAAHRRACQSYLAEHSVTIREKREIVIVSCGGRPYDLNMIQAHKALDMAAQACEEGGNIILLAECTDGLGRSDFLKWFDVRDSRELQRVLHQAYEVNGQTAWALLTKTERFQVHIVTKLPEDEVRHMRMIPSGSIAEALAKTSPGANGYIMPRGAAVLPVIPAT